MIDYLDKPPQRYAEYLGGMVESSEGEWVKFADMDMFMFEGGELLKECLRRYKALNDAAELVLRTYMPQFPDSRAVDDCLVGLASVVMRARSP